MITEKRKINQINLGPSDLLCDVYDHGNCKERVTVMTTDLRSVSAVSPSPRITIAPLTFKNPVSYI
jgi:hypothetical protein